MPDVRLINLTKGEIVLITRDGDLILERPPGKPASVLFHDDEIITVRCDGFDVPIVRRQLDRIVNLPDPRPGVLYLVSAMVAERANRPDVVFPSRPFTDKSGPFAARQLARVDEYRDDMADWPWDRAGGGWHW